MLMETDVLLWGLSSQAWITIVLVVGMFITLMKTRIPADVVFLAVMALLVISLTWYFEATEHHLAKHFDRALACYQIALEGFQRLGKTDNEVSTLQHIAEIKASLYDVAGSEEAYKQALALARQTGKADVQMGVLRELCNICRTIGDVRQAQAHAASMDSLMDATADLQTRFGYYNQKGSEARGLGQYSIAEQWFLRGKDIAEHNDANAVSKDKQEHLYSHNPFHKILIVYPKIQMHPADK